MSDLQTQLEDLEEPSVPGDPVDLTPPAAHRHRTATVPVVADEPREVHIRPVPGSITWAARRLEAPASPFVIGTFNTLRPPGPLGRSFIELIGPGGDIHHPTLEGYEAEESAPGGFGPMKGRISERVYRRHPDVYVQDAKVVHYLESDATCLHGGRLNAPQVSGGAVQLSDRGHRDRAERETVEHILYESQDMSLWHSNEADLEEVPDDRWTLEPQAPLRATAGEIVSLDFTGPGDNGSVIAGAWLPARDLARVTFRAEVGSQVAGNGAFIAVVSRRVPFSFDTRTDSETPDNQLRVINWEGVVGGSISDWVIEVDVDLTLEFVVGDDGPGGYGDNRGSLAQPAIVYPDWVGIEVGSDPDIGSPLPRIECGLFDVRTYGAGGPNAYGDRRMTPTEMVMDLFGRMGIRLFDVEPSGLNILPYEIPAGTTYADALDFASLLTNRPWVIRDTGHRAYGTMVPWDDVTWEVASPHAKLDTTGTTNRYNRVRVPFRYKDGQTLGSVLVRADPDPLELRSFFGLIDLEHPAMSAERAEELGQAIMRPLSREQVSGQFDIGEVFGPNGPTSGHHVFAGQTLDGSPSGRPAGLEVTSLRRGYDFVRGEFGGSRTGLAALDRMLARRDKRLAA